MKTNNMEMSRKTLNRKLINLNIYQITAPKDK